VNISQPKVRSEKFDNDDDDDDDDNNNNNNNSLLIYQRASLKAQWQIIKPARQK